MTGRKEGFTSTADSAGQEALTPYFMDDAVTLWHGDALDVTRSLTSGSVNCIVTSPPYYGLRDYGIEGQYGLEPTPSEYVAAMRDVFSEARRVLAKDGTLWLNLDDSYSVGSVPRHNTNQPNKNRDGSADRTFATFGGDAFAPGRETHGIPAKNLLGIPWRVAFALQDDGWILRNDIIWHKPNAMPESVTDRLSTRHEHLFLFSKSRRYWFDLDPIREPLIRPEALEEGIVFGGNSPDVGRRRGGTYGGPGKRPARVGQQPQSIEFGGKHEAVHEAGRNPGDVWSIPTRPFSAAHFAVFPSALAERCILAGCKPGGIVLDPFSGSGTTGLAATKLGRRYVGIDLNRDYLDLSLRTRLAQASLIDGEAS